MRAGHAGAWDYGLSRARDCLKALGGLEREDMIAQASALRLALADKDSFKNAMESLRRGGP